MKGIEKIKRFMWVPPKRGERKIKDNYISQV